MNTSTCFTKLYAGIELSKKTWVIVFNNGQKLRRISVAAGSIKHLGDEITKAKEKLGYAQDAVLCTCYEAGRDGYWIHRMLTEVGIENHVLDPASIEVPRRKRHKKTDRLDAEKLVRVLIRYREYGEKNACKTVNVPPEEAEDERRLGRELKRLKKEQTAHVSRMRSLYALHHFERLPSPLRCDLQKLRNWRNDLLQPQLVAELKREQTRLQLVHQQILGINREKRDRIKSPTTTSDHVARQLYRVSSIGEVSAWDISKELLAWRNFLNRKQVGGAVGLGGTPYDSGDSTKDQGISKEGNARIRALLIQIAWQWVQRNPRSPITQWYDTNFRNGTSRQRRIGIVAVARKILIRLWRYIDFGEAPLGVEITPETQITF